MSFVDYRDHLGSRDGKPFKVTLFSGDMLMLGINCLDPGQAQAPHVHDEQDKFYFVLEGEGEFVVDGELRTCGSGHAICAPAGVEHGVTNASGERLVVMVAMAPPPSR